MSVAEQVQDYVWPSPLPSVSFSTPCLSFSLHADVVSLPLMPSVSEVWLSEPSASNTHLPWRAATQTPPFELVGFGGPPASPRSLG